MDIWSLGIIAYKLMGKKEPYTEISDIKRIKAIKENPRDKLPEYYSQGLRDLVENLLTVDQDKHPTIEQYSQGLRDLVDCLLTVDQDKRPTIEEVLR
jgi:serine/threonine protein kinase